MVCCLLLLQLYLLKKYLKVSSSDKPLSANLLGTGLSHAFLKAMVCLLGKFFFLSHHVAYILPLSFSCSAIYPLYLLSLSVSCVVVVCDV